MKRLLLSLSFLIFTMVVFSQDYSNIYVVGAAFECGWDAGKAYPMEKENNGVFTWMGKMKRGDFKFLLKTTPSDLWINCLNSKINNEKIVLGKEHELIYVENSRITGGDYKFMMDNEGVFKVIVDIEKMTLIITQSDLISESSSDGRGKRIVNIHSYSGRASGDEHAYNLLIGKEENLKSTKNKWCTKDENPWVIFSLSGIYSINRFDFRDGRVKETGSNVKNLPEYKVFVSTTGIDEADWIEVIHEVNVGNQNEKSKKINPVEARYIKFVPVKDANDPYVRIYGVDMYGTFVRPINDEIISTGKTIIDYHNAWGNRETPANIIDGNIENAPGIDANNPWAFGKTTADAWVIIDLEDTYDIAKVVLTDSEEWLTGYKLYVSSFVGKDDDWKLVLDEKFEKLQVRKEVELMSPVSGRYLKLTIPSEYQEGLTRIREFEVYGALSEKPSIETNYVDLKSAYELALWTTSYNTTQDGILKAGARYDGKWTRDLSINVWNGYAFLEPEIAKNSLLSLLLKNEEELIGAEYWDKIIWVKGAYMYYLMTGDKTFLNQILKSGSNTLTELENMKRDNYPVFDTQYGLFAGPSVFNDGIAGYEEPVFSGNHLGGAVVSHSPHTQIKCLSTNCVYYEAYRILAEIAEALGEHALVPNFEMKASNLKANIREHLFNEETGKLYYLIDQNGKKHEFQEGLGISFAVLFGIVSPEEAEKIIEDAHITTFGLPSVYPHFKRFNDEKPGRHNVMIWPFINGFFADACLKTTNYDKFKFELFNLMDLALNKGEDNFWEIYDPKDGAPDGGWQTGGHWGGLEHQTWSATAFLNMVWYGLAGIQLDDGKINFSPYLPEEVNFLKLTGLKYGDMSLDITLEGEGTKIKEFKLNDQLIQNPEIFQNLSGKQHVYILLEEGDLTTSFSPQENELYKVLAENCKISISMLHDCVADKVELYDIAGTRITLKENARGVFSIGENLKTGVYLLKLKAQGTDSSRKIVLF